MGVRGDTVRKWIYLSLAGGLMALTGCSVVGTAASVTGAVVGTTVDVAATAVGTTADIVTSPIRD